MEQDNDAGRKDVESRGPLSGGFVWYLIAIGAASFSLFLAFFIFQRASDELSYTDFVRLVKATQTDVSAIEVQRKHSIIRYSNLSKVEIEKTQITAKTTKNVIERKGKPVDDINTKNNLKENSEIYVNIGEGEESLKRIHTLLDENQIPFEIAPGPNALMSYLPMFIFFGLILLLLFFMMRRIGGAGSPMAFGRSRGRMYAQEDLGVTFDDVAGIDEAVEEVREVVDFLQSPEKYQRLGGAYSQGGPVGRPSWNGKNSIGQGDRG